MNKEENWQQYWACAKLYTLLLACANYIHFVFFFLAISTSFYNLFDIT